MATSGKILGRLRDISWGGTVIDDLTQSALSISATVIDTTSNDSNRYASSKPGTMTFTVTGTALVAYDATEGYDEMLDDIMAGTEQTVLLTTGVTGDTTISGNAFCSAFDDSASTDEVMSFSFTIQVTGTVTKGVVV